MDILAQSLGLVADADQVSLSDGLVVQGSFLVDITNGARHRLRGPAGSALGLMADKTSARIWFRRAAGVGLSSREAAALIRSLNDIAGLRLEQRPGSKCLKRLKLRLSGGRPVVHARRYPGNARGLISAVARAIRSVLMTTLVVIMLSLAANTLTKNFLIAQLAFLASLFVTTVLHEAMHLWQAVRHGAAACVVVRGLRVGVLHEKLVTQEEIRSAVLGPLVGSLVSFGLAALVYMLSNSVMVAGSVGLVGIFHWFSWFPIYGDGRTLWRLNRGRYA